MLTALARELVTHFESAPPPSDLDAWLDFYCHLDTCGFGTMRNFYRTP